MNHQIQKDHLRGAEYAWKSVQNLGPARDPKTTRNIRLFLFYGSWNNLDHSHQSSQKRIDILVNQLTKSWKHDDFQLLSVWAIPVDSSEESLDICIGKNYFNCPSTLPSLALVTTDDSGEAVIEHCGVNSHVLMSLSNAKTSFQKLQSVKQTQSSISKALTKFTSSNQSNPKKRKSTKSNINDNTCAIRIFISGDRSKVGKSSVCMGILGNLLKAPFHYHPSELGYIKPATQCEETQLISKYCQSHGIEAIPVGPVVYFKGFTRAFLSGKTQSSSELLQQASQAVDRLCVQKKVVIVDGVGYPSVGSICGTDNASVAQAVGYPRINEKDRIPVPVILVGKSGVGDAVDSYNINATFFQYSNVPVLGAIFNRLSLEGYYSMENCKGAITDYFTKFKGNKEQVFGFVPELPSIAQSRTASEQTLEIMLESAEEFVTTFGKYVDMMAIIKAAETYQRKSLSIENDINKTQPKKVFTPNIVPSKSVQDESKQTSLSRKDIEMAASNAGASAA